MANNARITNGFWAEKLRLNAEVAIFHQWEMLESTHCIDNFRIAAGLKEGFREGFFFADSDAYKWLDAASRILAVAPDPKLEKIVAEFISILEKAQAEDGYLYTYNQIHFGNSRWQNLQIEHEFYCLGHLIEAGISHKQATGQERLFAIAQKAAGLLVERFWDAPPKYTDGHEEIEIALIKLSRFTGISRYRELAKRFLGRRGRIPNYPARFLWDALMSMGKANTVTALRRQYFTTHPTAVVFHLPAHNRHNIPRNMPLRFAAQVLSGKYTQQHKPVAQQGEPVGHAVRFAYLNTAAAMLARDEMDDSDLPRLVQLWQHMVNRRMSVSGGIGSLPLTEGFGRDYELDPELVYNETCAALACMLWNHEMALLTGAPEYDDLFEWQLYNAAAVGIGVDGCSFFYNNPLTSNRGFKREAWYDIPCCPSNLSRVWESLADQAVSSEGNTIFIHQFLGGEFELEVDRQIRLVMTTGLPAEGWVKAKLEMDAPQRMMISFRKPAWADSYSFTINGEPITPEHVISTDGGVSAVGLNFDASAWVYLERVFQPGDEIAFSLGMPVRLFQQDKRIAKCGGQVAVSRGPLLYCSEGIDNPEWETSRSINSSSLVVEENNCMFDGIPTILAHSPSGQPVRLIPYYQWGNRGETTMSVFLRNQL